MNNATYVRISLKQRIADVEKEIKGVKALFNITQFEIDVMNTLKTLDVGSRKQLQILDSIEIKVFGRSRHSEKAA